MKKDKTIKKLISIIYTEIKNHEEKQEKIRNLYGKLVDLNGLKYLLTDYKVEEYDIDYIETFIKSYYKENYKKYINSLKKSIKTKNMVLIQNFISEIKILQRRTKNEYQYLETDIKRNEAKYKSLKYSFAALNSNGCLYKDDFKFIKQIMKEYNFTQLEKNMVQEYCIEQTRKATNPNHNNSSIIIPILYDDIDEIELEENESYKKKYSNYIKSIVSSINIEQDYNKIMEYLPRYDENHYTKDEFNYIIKSVMISLVDDLKFAKDLLMDIDSNSNNVERVLTARDYMNTKNKYTKVKYYLNNTLNIQNGNEKKEEMKKEQERLEEELRIKSKEENVNNILYLLRNNSESFLEKDLKDIGKENLETIKTLIDDIKKDKQNKNVSSINTQGENILSIKSGQVRLFYKSIGYNDQLIIGATLMKTDKSAKFFDSYISRIKSFRMSDYKNIKDKSSEIEEKVNQYINKNKRKKYR